MEENEENEEMTIEGLCDDILIMIFKNYLGFKTQIISQRVCTRFHRLISSIYGGKRALHLTEKSKTLYEFTNEDLSKYWSFPIDQLYELREGFWIRTSSGALRLLQPLDIQLLVLQKHKNLRDLCLVITTKTSLDSLIDKIVENCSCDLEKLIIINLPQNQYKFPISETQMECLCKQYPNLKHFEIFSDYLYASEECFRILMTQCKRLEVFKLNVKHIFKETKESLSVGWNTIYESFKFNGISFSQSNGRLTTIYGSRPVFNDIFIVKSLEQMADHFVSVTDLSVERLSQIEMQRICTVFPKVETFSFSMDPNYETNKTMITSFMKLILNFTNLRKLSIRWFTRHPNHKTVALDFDIFNQLKNCSNLKHLIIKEAAVRETTIHAISVVFPSLQSLHLIECGLSPDSLLQIKDLTQLKELFVLKSVENQNYMKWTDIKMDENTVYEIVENCIKMELIESLNDLKDNNNEPNDPQFHENFIIGFNHHINHFPNLQFLPDIQIDFDNMDDHYVDSD